MSVHRSPRVDIGRIVSEASELRRRSERHRPQFWSRHVTHPIGGILVWILLDTPVTPNQVSIASLLVSVAGAVVVAVTSPPAPPVAIALAFLLLQLGASLDCTDGQLARVRGISSPFGAWLDQIIDFVGHTAVGGAFVVFAARAAPLDPVGAVAVATLLLGGSLLGLFASAERNALLGTDPAVKASDHPRLGRLFVARNLTDYAAILAVSSIALAWPPLLVATLIVAPLILIASVVAQVAINWPRR